MLSFINLMEESTTFEEAFGGNEARLPSFTLCPDKNAYKNKSIESFEDVAQEIENVKMNFKIQYYEYRAYEDPKIIDETYNQTLNNDWYFVPKTSAFHPFQTVICLILAPFKDHKPNSDWNIGVSYFNLK